MKVAGPSKLLNPNKNRGSYNSTGNARGTQKTMKKLSILFLFFILSGAVNASIIDTKKRSFIDDVEHLEWMDFGVNNRYTYNQVVEMTKDGGLYEQWDLATERQVLTLWKHAFSGQGSTYDKERRRGNVYARYDDIAGNGHTVHEPMFDIMGYNYSRSYKRRNHSYKLHYSIGLFKNDVGALSHTYIRDYEFSRRQNGKDSSYVAGRTHSFDKYQDSTRLWFSTMLVRDTLSQAPSHNRASDVPEPISIALFGLGLVGLISMRKKPTPAA